MRGSLSIQLSIFRRQKAFIAQVLGTPSSAFQSYQKRYEQRTATFRKIISVQDAQQRISAADLVYVGDYHTLRYAQESFLRLVQQEAQGSRPVVLALEFVEGQHQPTLDAYLRGKLSEKTFLRRIAHPYQNGFDIWPHFRPIFEFARNAKIPVLGIDYRASGPKSLKLRDRFAAARIHDVFQREQGAKVLILMGQYHIAPEHLPHEVNRLFRRNKQPKSVIVYQNCDDIYWKLARRGLCHAVEAVDISDQEICLINASPIACQQSFIEYLDAETQEDSTESSASSRVKEYVRHLGSWLGMAVLKPLRQLQVESVYEWPHLLENARLDSEHLRAQLLRGESFYAPQANVIFLSSHAMSHGVEAAAQFLLHLGQGSFKPRSNSDAFFAQCIRHALSFWASKFFNPHRTCPPLEVYARDFSNGKPEQKEAAAYILALKSTEWDESVDVETLLPSPRHELRHVVERALGCLLGESLFQRFSEGQLNRRNLQEMFQTPLDKATQTYLKLTQGSVKAISRSPSRSKALAS